MNQCLFQCLFPPHLAGVGTPHPVSWQLAGVGTPNPASQLSGVPLRHPWPCVCRILNCLPCSKNSCKILQGEKRWSCKNLLAWSLQNLEHKHGRSRQTFHVWSLMIYTARSWLVILVGSCRKPVYDHTSFYQDLGSHSCKVLPVIFQDHDCSCMIIQVFTSMITKDFETWSRMIFL